jgi:hypothetical protein
MIDLGIEDGAGMDDWKRGMERKEMGEIRMCIPYRNGMRG